MIESERQNFALTAALVERLRRRLWIIRSQNKLWVRIVRNLIVGDSATLALALTSATLVDDLRRRMWIFRGEKKLWIRIIQKLRGLGWARNAIGVAEVLCLQEILPPGLTKQPFGSQAKKVIVILSRTGVRRKNVETQNHKNLQILQTTILLRYAVPRDPQKDRSPKKSTAFDTVGITQQRIFSATRTHKTVHVRPLSRAL